MDKKTASNSAYSDIFTSFLQENFGKTIGLRLLQMAEKRQGVTFAQLETAEQFEFIKTTLYHMYKKFYTSEKIRVFILEIFFRHLRKKIENQIEIESTKNTHMKDVTLNFSLLQDVEDIVVLTKTDVKLFMAISEPVQAGCIILIDPASCRTIMRAHCAMHDKKYQTDMQVDTKAIQEFIETLIPSIEANIKKTFNTTLKYEFSTKENVVETFTKPSEDYVIEMITTTVNATLDNESMVLNMTFLVKSTDEEMLVKAKKQKQREFALLFEQSPPKIFTKFNPNIKQNLHNFLEKVSPNQAQSILDEIQTSNISLEKPLSPKDARIYIGLIISNLENCSDNKKRCVRANLEEILTNKHE